MSEKKPTAAARTIEDPPNTKVRGRQKQRRYTHSITSLIELKYIQNVVRYYFRDADTEGKTLRENKGLNLWLSLEPRASPCGSNGKELARSAGDSRDLSSVPESGKFPGEGNGNPLQYSCLRNPMDRGVWWAIVHRVTKGQT